MRERGREAKQERDRFTYMYFVPQIFYYSTAVFKLAGVNSADIATVAVGLVLVLVTLFTVSFTHILPLSSLLLSLCVCVCVCV